RRALPCRLPVRVQHGALGADRAVGGEAVVPAEERVQASPQGSPLRTLPAVTTIVVSDLHLGTRSHPWLLSTAEARETLARAVADADRLVLLGDAVELRESPVADALEAARPTLAALGEAMSGRQITLVPGNHDHQLAAP